MSKLHDLGHDLQELAGKLLGFADDVALGRWVDGAGNPESSSTENVTTHDSEPVPTDTPVDPAPEAPPA